MTSPIPDTTLAELRRLEQLATPGPFVVGGEYHHMFNMRGVCIDRGDDTICTCWGEDAGEEQTRADAEFFAAARNHMASLLSDISALREAVRLADEMATAVTNNPCRHDAGHTSKNCSTCLTLAAYLAARRTA